MDDAALLATDPDRSGDAFAMFYRRHLPMVLAFVLPRVHRDRELAADITAEVFAKALAARARFNPSLGDARAWLCTIAVRIITDSVRKGRVEDRTRRQLELQPVYLYDDDLDEVDRLVFSGAGEAMRIERLLDEIGPETRHAVRERILRDRSYEEIAAGLQTSESVIRKRVSRGLAQLRTTMETS